MKWWLVLGLLAAIVDEVLEGDSFFIAGLVVSLVFGFIYGFLRAFIRHVSAWNRERDEIVAYAIETFAYDDYIVEVRSSFWKREILMLIGGGKWSESFD